MYWSCRCECGATTEASTSQLRGDNTRSCGCLKRESMLRRFTKHGRYGTREYRSWIAAKGRCYNPNNQDYANYGGRGIAMSDEWRDDFNAFLRDMGACPAQHSIDRIDSDRGYETGNCRWAPAVVQARNQRSNHRITFDGQTLTLGEWAERKGLTRTALEQRVKAGWPLERALTAPLRHTA